MHIQRTEKIILDEDADFLIVFRQKLENIADSLEDGGLTRVVDNLYNAINDFLEHPDVFFEG